MTKDTLFVVAEGGVIQYVSTTLSELNIVLIDRDEEDLESALPKVSQPDAVGVDAKRELGYLCLRDSLKDEYMKVADSLGGEDNVQQSDKTS